MNLDSPSPLTRALFFVKRAIGQALFRVRRFLSLSAQIVQRDELRELANEARVLGSASAESIDHVGAELREINGRLSKLEADVEQICRLLEEGAANGIGSEKPSETAARSLTTE
jgi:hypothetical protein